MKTANSHCGASKKVVGKHRYGKSMPQVSRQMQDGPGDPARIWLQASSE